MPGPKMGPRPADFNEETIRQSPTFAKWTSLEPGEKLRYACREFVKGQGDDEERLMRRIMIARRNNIRDHETLKKARRQNHPNLKVEAGTTKRVRRPPSSFSDSQVEKEMDVTAVEHTRSYRTWADLADGSEFVYNQKYIKGREGHDWLLRKNIWRRMRYRRENKKMVEHMKVAGEGDAAASQAAAVAAGSMNLLDQAAVEAAVAAAESFGQVQNPLDDEAAQAALDAAAQLAAAGAEVLEEEEKDCKLVHV